MRINKRPAKPSAPGKVKIRKHHEERLAFNFSFLTQNAKYNLDHRSKTINQKVRLKLIEQIYQLSQDDIVTVIGSRKALGLEKMPEAAVRLSMHPEFKRSERYDECEPDYWVFRLGKLGRVIGKKNGNIFYIMSIDASFDQYQH